MKTRSFPKIILTMSALFIFCGLLTATSGAASFTVNNTGDNGGVNPAPGAGTGTLRQAIVDANATSGADTITFTVTGTILLASELPGLFDDVAISGPGANALTVKRDPSAAAFRIFLIGVGKTVTISGLTITNGSSTNFGGGINNGGTLTVTNSTISGNSGGTFGGGGIYNFGGEGGSATLMVINSTLSGNSAANRGGGIFNDSFYGSSTVTITNSTLSDNSAYDGGGIYNENGGEGGSATVTVTNSTFSGNSADGTGGGIYNVTAPGSTTVTVTNSTFSGNSAHTFSAGGIFNNCGTRSPTAHSAATQAASTTAAASTTTARPTARR